MSDTEEYMSEHEELSDLEVIVPWQEIYEEEEKFLRECRDRENYERMNEDMLEYIFNHDIPLLENHDGSLWEDFIKKNS